MPARATRSSTRGRSPLGFGGSGGSRGSMISHSSSVTSSLLMLRSVPSTHEQVLARYSYCRGSTSRSGVGRLPRRSTRPKAPSSRGSCNGRKSAPRAPWSGARRPMPETTACRRASARRPGTAPIWRPSEVSAGAVWRTLRPVPCGFALVSRSLPDLPGSRRTSLANHRTRGYPSESTTVAGGRHMALHTSKTRPRGECSP